jgi:hypothetical protein
MIPLEIFRDWDVCICQWNNLASGMVMFGQFYYIAIYFTIVFNYSPQQAGQQLLYFLPGLGVGAWSAIVFVLKVFHGTKFVLIAGSIIMAIATGLFAMAVQQKVKGELFGFMAMLGVGVGLVPHPYYRTKIDIDAYTVTFTSSYDAVFGYCHFPRIVLSFPGRYSRVNFNVVCRQQ